MGKVGEKKITHQHEQQQSPLKTNGLLEGVSVGTDILEEIWEDNLSVHILFFFFFQMLITFNPVFPLPEIYPKDKL